MGALIVRFQDPKNETDEDDLGRFELSNSGARDAARELSARLRGFGFSDRDPLFISLRSA